MSVSVRNRRPLVLISILLLGVSVKLGSVAWGVEGVGGHTLVDQKCVACHQKGADGKLDGIESVRMTPEGWRMTLSRMERVHALKLADGDEENLVKYLSDEYGLAPEEIGTFRYALERRPNHPYETVSDPSTGAACKGCHSFARIALQRRSPEMWKRMPDTLLGLLPLTELQVRGIGANWYDMARAAVPYLTKTFPFESDDWGRWKGHKKADLSGKWAVVGHDPGSGDYTGEMTVERRGEDRYEGKFRVELANGKTVSGTTAATVYTGYNWRGEGKTESGSVVRDIFFASADGTQMEGRSLQTAYGDLGADETLYKINGTSRVLAVTPRGLEADAKAREIRIFGSDLPEKLNAEDVKLGEGVQVRKIVRSDSSTVVAEIVVAKDATAGSRSVKVGGATGADLAVVYGGIDYIKLLPDNALVHLSGDRMPKQYQQFEVAAFLNGPDGKKGTEDDVRIDRIASPTWRMTEYYRSERDDDLKYVGKLGKDGLFTPAGDGPNPARRLNPGLAGSDSNSGDVWVWASYEQDGRNYEARGYLIVSPALFVFTPIQ